MAAAVFMLVVNDVVAVAWSPTWAPLVFFAALVVVLSIRPQGLFGSLGSPRPVSQPSRWSRAAALPGGRGSALGARAVVLGALPARDHRSDRDLDRRVYTLIFMVATAAWNVFSGYSGYLALGHAVFFGSGGYAVALAARDWHFKGGWDVFALLPVRRPRRRADRRPGRAGRAAHPAPHLRRGHDRDLLHLPARRLQPRLHRRHVGHHAAVRDRSRRPTTTSRSTTSALVILCSPWRMSWAVRRSRFGLQLLAIRDDEDRALGLGVKTRRVKLIAFVLSAFPVGMVGGLYFYFLGQIFPQFAYDPLFDVSLALMGFLGGIGTLVGPLLGALVLESLQQYFTQTVLGHRDLPDHLRRPVPGRDPAAAARRRSELTAHCVQRPAARTGAPDRVARTPRGGGPRRGRRRGWRHERAARGHGRLEVLRRRARAVGMPPRGPGGRRSTA